MRLHRDSHHNRTRRAMGNLNEEDNNHHASCDESVKSDDGELYRLESRNKRVHQISS